MLKRFFSPVVETLSKFASGEVELGKEALQRHLRLVRKIFVAISELSGPEVTETCSSALSSVMGWIDKLHIRQTCQHLTRFQSYFKYFFLSTSGILIVFLSKARGGG